MPHQYAAAITLPNTAAIITIAHNIGNTPHVCTIRPTISIASYRWTEVARDASVFVVTAGASADAAGRVDLFHIPADIR